MQMFLGQPKQKGHDQLHLVSALCRLDLFVEKSIDLAWDASKFSIGVLLWKKNGICSTQLPFHDNLIKQ
jgi:hypothetical protein